jgi:outer membrane lipoprotein-sorting protein
MVLHFIFCVFVRIALEIALITGIPVAADVATATSEVAVMSETSTRVASAEEHFISDMENNRGKITTIACRFHQTKQLPYLKNPAKSTGDFYYQNGQIAILYNEPKGDCIIMNERHCKTVVNGKSQTVATNSHSALKQTYQIIQASISGNIKTIFNVFDMNVSETNTMYHIKLTPKQKSIKEKIAVIEMDFDKKDLSLSMLKTTKTENDFVKYEFFQKSFNKSINQSFE